MLFKTRSASVFGIEAHLVDVEVNLTAGTNGEFHIVGLPDVAVRESRSRVIAAGYRRHPQVALSARHAQRGSRSDGDSARDEFLAILTIDGPYQPFS